MKTAAIICHARFLDLAGFDETLRAAGYQIRYYDAGCDDLTFDSVAPDLLVALGGDRKSTRLNSSHIQKSRMPSSA